MFMGLIFQCSCSNFTMIFYVQSCNSKSSRYHIVFFVKKKVNIFYYCWFLTIPLPTPSYHKQACLLVPSSLISPIFCGQAAHIFYLLYDCISLTLCILVCPLKSGSVCIICFRTVHISISRVTTYTCQSVFIHMVFLFVI